MGDQIARAEEFEKKAEKKLNGWGLFGSKYEDAADLFDKAANSFKLAKSCTLIFFFLLLLFDFLLFCLFPEKVLESEKKMENFLSCWWLYTDAINMTHFCIFQVVEN